MLAFTRSGSPFTGNGQIWAKALPNGEPVKLTDVRGSVWAPAFTPDSANVVYSTIDPQHGTWDTWTVPVSGGAAADEAEASGIVFEDRDGSGKAANNSR